MCSGRRLTEVAMKEKSVEDKSPGAAHQPSEGMFNADGKNNIWQEKE